MKTVFVYIKAWKYLDSDTYSLISQFLTNCSGASFESGRPYCHAVGPLNTNTQCLRCNWLLTTPINKIIIVNTLQTMTFLKFMLSNWNAARSRRRQVTDYILHFYLFKLLGCFHRIFKVSVHLCCEAPSNQLCCVWQNLSRCYNLIQDSSSFFYLVSHPWRSITGAIEAHAITLAPHDALDYETFQAFFSHF